MIRRLSLEVQRRQLAAKALENRDFKDYVTSSRILPEETTFDYNPIQLAKYLEIRRRRLDSSLQRIASWKKRDLEMITDDHLPVGSVHIPRPELINQPRRHFRAYSLPRA
ncbi:unnamed protein product [Echinostoma caproni]|uniref:Complex III subunit VII n=1 Tax=Echinostoma caproni TaxID=27848 RepID=A0A183AZT0_9TREM|nr:unnamed protein product [Echinostoma caproni]